MAEMNPITRERIVTAEVAIRPFIRRTPLLQSDTADFGLAAGALTFKLEFLQHSGSFKARGAFANLLLRKVPAAGVVAASGGNHGVAVACAAQRLRVPATIFVPDVASIAKQDAIRGYGAELVIAGSRYADEAFALLEQVGMGADANRACGVLAYGDVKRVELAIALANRPKLLLMDEPTAGMAPKERVALMALTASIWARKE